MKRKVAGTVDHAGFCWSFAHAVQQHVLTRGEDATSVMTAMGCAGGSGTQQTGRRVRAMRLSAGLNEAARLLGDAQVGLRSGIAMMPSHMGALGFAMMTAPKGIDALRLVESLQWLVTTEWGVTHEIQGAKILVTQTSMGKLPTDYPFWSFLAACRINLLRSACGQHLTPHLIELPCEAPTDTQALQSFMGAPVRFGASVYKEWLPASPLHSPNPQGSREIHLMMQGAARRQWQALFNADEAFVVQLKRAIQQMLQDGESPTMRALSRRHTIVDASGTPLNARQVQRRLTGMNRTFRESVAEVRRELALAQLRSTQRPVADIAAEAGYSEPSAFHRAVRRWTGLTPMTIRESAKDLDKV